jgi:hypothetical protein
MVSAITKVGLAGLVGAAALVLLVGLLDGRFSALSVLWPPQRQTDTLSATMEGAIKAVDAVTNTVQVTAGLLGLGARPFVIAPGTVIAVNGKLGGFGDLTRDQRVRVAYEIVADRFLATRIDVLDGWTQPADDAASAEADDDAQITAVESRRSPASVRSGARAARSARVPSRPTAPEGGATVSATTPAVPSSSSPGQIAPDTPQRASIGDPPAPPADAPQVRRDAPPSGPSRPRDAVSTTPRRPSVPDQAP